MANLILISLLILTNIATAQIDANVQPHCVPPPITREIVEIDSLAVHHSYCLRLLKIDRLKRIVISTTICDTSNGNTNFLLDTSQIGMRYDEYYDSTGRIIFESTSKNNKVLECYNIFVYESSGKLKYKEGYKLSELIRIDYEYDKYGNYSKKTTTTQNE